MADAFLPRAVVDRLELQASVEAEAASPPNLLPSRVAEVALRPTAEGYAHHLREKLLTGWGTIGGELVWAPKSRLHYRPVLAVGFDARVIFRALIHEVIGAIPESSQRAQIYHDMTHGILSSVPSWVVIADVAAFFQFIDHQLLTDELVTQTANGEGARALQELLFRLMGRAVGLPQALDASRYLAEFYIAPVERSLLQEGFTVRRASDDFRIAAASNPEAFVSLTRLQTYLYERGLALNEAKTQVVDRTVYEAHLTPRSTRLQALMQRQEIQDPYSEPDDKGQVIKREVAEAAYRKALKNYSLNASTPEERSSARSLLLATVRWLGRAGSPAALKDSRRILSRDPSLTLAYITYFDKLGEQGSRASVIRTVSRLLLDQASVLPVWQQAVLAKPFMHRRALLSPAIEDWAVAFWRGTAPSVLRARAALLLSAHGKIEAGEIAAQMRLVHPAARFDLVAAMALLARGEARLPAARAALHSDPTFTTVYQYTAEHAEVTDWL